MRILERIDNYLEEEVPLSESTKKELDNLKAKYKEDLQNRSLSQMQAQKLRDEFEWAFVIAKLKGLKVTDKQLEKLEQWGISSPPKSTSKKLKGLSRKFNVFNSQAEKESMKIAVELKLDGKF